MIPTQVAVQTWAYSQSRLLQCPSLLEYLALHTKCMCLRTMIFHTKTRLQHPHVNGHTPHTLPTASSSLPCLGRWSSSFEYHVLHQNSHHATRHGFYNPDLRALEPFTGLTISGMLEQQAAAHSPGFCSSRPSVPSALSACTACPCSIRLARPSIRALCWLCMASELHKPALMMTTAPCVCFVI